MTTKKRLPPYLTWLIALAVAGLLGVGYYVQKNHLAEQIRWVQKNLNVPARYAFIMGKSSAKLHVFDTYDGLLVDMLPLKTIPELVGISRLGGYVVYAKRGGNRFFILNLQDKTTTTISAKTRIEELAVHSGGQLIVYAGKDGVFSYQPARKDGGKILSQPKIRLNFTPDGTRLLMTASEQGSLWQLNIADGAVKSLLNMGKKLSMVSLMPDSRAIFFIADSHLYRYDLFSGQLSRADVAALNYRPYISSDGRKLFVIAQSTAAPKLLVLNPETLATINTYDLPDIQQQSDERAVMVTGWLEQVAVVAGNKTLHFIDVETGALHSTPIFADVLDMVVQADSKTLLVTTGAHTTLEKPRFLFYDLRDKSLRAENVYEDFFPTRIMMGETNTLCH